MKSSRFFICFSMIVFSLFVSGCASTFDFLRSEEEKNYLAKAEVQELTFTIPKSDESAAWARAQQAIAEYGLATITVASDILIQTETHPVTGQYYYSIQKNRINDEIQIKISGDVKVNKFQEDFLNRNLHLLAYIIKTGNLPPSKKLFH